MFIAVTLPHGIAYLRADRIESVMPIAQSEAEKINGQSHQHRTMITMIGGEEDAWWVAEETPFVIDKIMHEIRQISLIGTAGVNHRTIERMENQIVTLLNRTSGNVPRDGG